MKFLILPLRRYQSRDENDEALLGDGHGKMNLRIVCICPKAQPPKKSLFVFS